MSIITDYSDIKRRAFGLKDTPPQNVVKEPEQLSATVSLADLATNGYAVCTPATPGMDHSSITSGTVAVDDGFGARWRAFLTQNGVEPQPARDKPLYLARSEIESKHKLPSGYLITIDFVTDNLIVHGPTLSFCVTRHAIDDNVHVSQFAPALAGLVEAEKAGATSYTPPDFPWVHREWPGYGA